MTGNDTITAIVDQLAAHAEQLTRLDTRQADHHAAVSARLAELSGQAAALGRVVQEHAAALTRLTAPSQLGPDPDGYNPEPVPAWWKLTAAERPEPIARLRAWVEQVYRPGYGHLAVTLGPCWPSHDLCLYGLDIASELWSLLYLQPARSRRARVGPGRIPGPHPARPGRPAPDRDEPLRPPRQSRTGRRPVLEQAMTDTMLRQALEYAARGWPVFPCQAGQKTPATAHGYRDATTDPEQITAWFAQGPQLEPGHRHRRPRTRRPGRRRPRPGRERVRRVRHAAAGRPAGRRGRCTYAPPAAGCTPTSPVRTSATATCPPSTWTSAPGAATSWPRRPRSTVKPYQVIRTLQADGGLDWATVTALLEPRRQIRQPHPHPAPDRDLSHLARWVAGQAEGNRNAGLFWAANRALDADPAADLSPLAAAARQAGLGEREITRTLDSARHSGRTGTHAPDYQPEAGDQA